MPITKQQLADAVATVESLQGNYLSFAASTQDPEAKKRYQAMAADVSQHLARLHQQLNQMEYSEWIKQIEPAPPRLKNALAAFVGGGLVCLLGEGITDFWERVLGISHQEAADPTVATLIFLASLLTGLGWFDKLARYVGAGLSVPVTGFANALTCCALEFKREGLIFGIGGRMFQLAGAVIVYGVVTAFFVGLLTSLVRLLQ
jgi:stage V sporulation protein AC